MIRYEYGTGVAIDVNSINILYMTDALKFAKGQVGGTVAQQVAVVIHADQQKKGKCLVRGFSHFNKSALGGLRRAVDERIKGIVKEWAGPLPQWDPAEH